MFLWKVDAQYASQLFCDQIGYCRLRAKFVQELDLAKALADAMASIRVEFPLPIGSLAVYLVCERGLDWICNCESRAD